jgi:hypothetical protein
MDELQLDEVFVEREFETHDVAGNVTPVILRVGKPQKNAPNDWQCAFQIIGIGDEKILFGSGVDSLHALFLALQLADALLKYFARHEQKRITWLNRDDLGLATK